MSRFNLTSSLPVSLALGLCLVGYGFYMFLSQWAYSEAGHEYLLAAYILCSIVVFFSLRMSKIGSAIFFVMILFFIIFYSNQKFEWRKSYIQDAAAGQYFPLEQYIESYPIYEQQTFPWFFDGPNWVAFSKECYEPFLSGTLAEAKKSVGRNCQEAELIRDYYGINLITVIKDHYSKMRKTAKQLQKGRFKTKKKFETCIQSKKCVMIPLLPAGAEDITQQSKQYLDIRKQFWSLINDDKISVQNCNFFDICRIAVITDLLTMDDINK